MSDEESTNVTELSNALAKNEARRSYPRTHINFWKARLERRRYKYNGITSEAADWSIRIHCNEIRKDFDLESADKEEAATKARDIYISLVSKGWPEHGLAMHLYSRLRFMTREQVIAHFDYILIPLQKFCKAS